MTNDLHQFKCPTCGLRAWAEINAKLSCISCGEWAAPSPLGGYIGLRRVGAEVETGVGKGDALRRLAVSIEQEQPWPPTSVAPD